MKTNYYFKNETKGFETLLIGTSLNIDEMRELLTKVPISWSKLKEVKEDDLKNYRNAHIYLADDKTDRTYRNVISGRTIVTANGNVV